MKPSTAPVLYNLQLQRARLIGLCPRPANDVFAVIIGGTLPAKYHGREGSFVGDKDP